VFGDEPLLFYLRQPENGVWRGLNVVHGFQAAYLLPCEV